MQLPIVLICAQEVVHHYDFFRCSNMTYASHKELSWDRQEQYRFVIADISELSYFPPCDYLINV